MAFTLGLFGSLHCIGMCGPLALGVNKLAAGNQYINSLLYNFGRVITYSILGLIFGLIGEAFAIAGLQRIFSIIAGIVLIILFIISLDLEQLLYKIPAMKKSLGKLSSFVQRIYQNEWAHNPLIFGLANGLLPCGLVYLAIAGSLTAESIVEGILFMAVFGLATIPILFVLMVSGNWLNHKVKMSFRKLLPFVQLFVGIYLIYRGLVVGMPEELDFYSALKHPIMCH